MAEVWKQNDMRGELPIRELEYRKKVANFFQSDECIKDLMPLQVIANLFILTLR